MGILGKILALPVRIINVPLRTVDMLTDPNSGIDDDDGLGSILETVAKAIEEVDGDND